MRQIGTIEERDAATRFGDYLASQGISCAVEPGGSGYTVWVHEEDQITRAKEELAQFQKEPGHERYRGAQGTAKVVTQQRVQKSKAIRARTIDMRDRWTRPAIDSGPVTFGLMALMVVVAILTGVDPAKHQEFFQRMVFSMGDMQEIRSGEVWRLITPIFLHFGPWHFLFNLLALRDFGLMTEYRLGPPKFFAMVIVIAVLSNFAQFEMTGGRFGGMSGVNYGLFGYVWVRGKLDPESGVGVDPTNVTYMLGWFVLCFVGIIPNVANGAHLVGLAIGAAMGASGPVLKKIGGR